MGAMDECVKDFSLKTSKDKARGKQDNIETDRKKLCIRIKVPY
jgi:hypothetical protein